MEINPIKIPIELTVSDEMAATALWVVNEYLRTNPDAYLTESEAGWRLEKNHDIP